MNSSARVRVRSLLCSFVIAVSVVPLAGQAAVGRSPTAFDVSQTGESSYSIPIVVPPGTHGMTPQMALAYGHRNGSTLVGAGWSIAGLSAISRCQKTWASDGEARAVRNDYQDRFCLDGNKLRLTSGTYGYAGSTYQTEVETFSRVTGYGSAGNGPAYFIVEAKDGLIYEYGNTTDSRIESVGQSTARTWAVNKIRDRSGNSILFAYFEDTTNGAYRIDTVDYTSNASQGLTAAYRIDFVWETKPSNEIDSGYIAGSVVKEITRLDRIDVMYSPPNVVRRYELTYEGALSSTSKSRLASVQDCAGSPLDCLPATTFVYQNGTTGLNAEVDTGVSVPATPWPIDVNGDGRDDLVYSSNATSGSGYWMVMLANASGGFNSPINTGVVNTNYTGATSIDYNADGLEDLLVPYSGSTWWVMLGGAGGLSSPSDTGAPVTATGAGANARALDVNGDGLDDLVWADLIGYAGGDAIRYRLREWGGAFSSAVYYLAGPFAANSKLTNGVFAPSGQPMSRHNPDFNGDGRDDLVYRWTNRTFNDGTGVWKYFYRMGVVCTGAWAYTIASANAGSTPYFGDFNGDGNSDLVYYDQSALIKMRFSTGTSMTGEVSLGSLGSYSGGWAIFDWDGDGYDDLLMSSGSAWYLRRSTGETLSAPVATGFASGTQTSVSDVNGDGLLDLSMTIGGTHRYRTHAGAYPDFLQTATDGFANYATFSYAPLTSGNYSKYADASFPEQDYQGSMYVVNSHNASNGIGGSYTNTYHYFGARVHLQGRGFEGFNARRSNDSRTGLWEYAWFNRQFPYIGTRYQFAVYQPNHSTLISQTTDYRTSHSYGGGNETRHLPYTYQTNAAQYEYGGAQNGQLIRSALVQNSVDWATGMLYDSTTTTTEAASGNGAQAGAAYVQRNYLPLANFVTDTTYWCIGRPGQQQQINSHNQYGGSAVTRTTNLTWDTVACRVTQAVIEPGHGQLQVTRTLGYDGFGNLNSDSVTGIGMTARTTTASWGSTGQFPVSVTNALSQLTGKGWDYSIGVQTSETDPNGISVSWQHDPFGRKVRENRPDGTFTTLQYNVTPAWCDPRSKYYVVARSYTSTSDEVLATYAFMDAADRSVNEYRLALSGTNYETVVRSFDALGRLASEGMPYLSGGCTSYSSPFAATYQYDLLSRITQVSRPVSDSDPTLQNANFYYEGLTARAVDPLGKQTTRASNAVGGLARSTDHNGYYQQFDYDAFGNPVRVYDSLGNTLQTNTFNIRGMRTAQSDMDAGSWSFTPNALGEIVSQTDAKSQATTMGYDLLGRLTSRTEAEGTSTFTFGTSAAAKNIGRLASLSGPGYSEGYTYDSIGRPQTTTITSDATYGINYSYNSLGLLDTLTYPTSTSGYRLKLQYEYQYARLLRVRDYNAPSTIFWQANSADAWGNVIDETLGNGIQTIRGYDQVTGALDYIQSGSGGSIQNLNYAWDRAGNLTQRQDVRQGLTEAFYYDNLYRLDYSTLNSVTNLDMSYDAMGNITYKSGVGSYTYHATKKHAVTAAGSNSYGYDANGNASTRNGYSISWYSYNLPNTINGSGSNSSQFFYTPARARWKQQASYAGTSEQTIYIGGVLEKVTLGTTVSWKHYIAGGSGPVAVYTRKSSGVNELHYLTKDHLGSVDSVTNAAGAIEVRTSFASFGQRRNEAGWSGNPTSGDWTQITNTTRHGFTLHEMLDNLNLTHMNGRVYDQVAGRFLSADPFVQAPGFSQSFNRYAYVFNNPLSHTDPSGFVSTDIERPGAKYFTYYEFMALLMGGAGPARAGVHGPRPDLWQQRRDALIPGTTPFPDGPAPDDPTPTVTPLRFPELVDADRLSTAGGTCLNGRGACHMTPPPPVDVDWTGVANDWWPGYQVGTCIYEGCSGGKWILGAIGAWPGGKAITGTSLLARGALSTTGKTLLRVAALDIWRTRMGKSAAEMGLEVHHRIPLEWAHLFPDIDPNRAANLVGVPGVEHWRITAAWNQWRVNLGGRIPSQAEIEGFALGIDAAFFDVMTRLP